MGFVHFLRAAGVVVCCALLGCHGPMVGAPLDATGSGGNGGAAAGGGGGGGGATGGSGGAGGATGGSGGAGGATGGGGGAGGATGQGGTGGQPACMEGSFRPGQTTCSAIGRYLQQCASGAWHDTATCQQSCDLVTCSTGSLFSCCAGWGVFALTATTFLPAPQLITSSDVNGTTSVTATFNFSQPYQVGALQLLLPTAVPLTSVQATLSFSGDVYVDATLDRDTGAQGARYNVDGTGYLDATQPLDCFPTTQPCTTTFDEIDIRLRPNSTGVASLTITGLAFTTGP
jgi:hypothetical protein